MYRQLLDRTLDVLESVQNGLRMHQDEHLHSSVEDDLLHEEISSLMDDIKKEMDSIEFCIRTRSVSDSQILSAATDAVRRKAMTWTGFEKDQEGRYTIPVLSKSDFDFARVVIDLWSDINSDVIRNSNRYLFLRSDGIEVKDGQREIYVVMSRLPFREDQNDEILTEYDLDFAVDSAMKANE